jgi:hypothetical protein
VDVGRGHGHGSVLGGGEPKVTVVPQEAAIGELSASAGQPVVPRGIVDDDHRVGLSGLILQRPEAALNIPGAVVEDDGERDG